MFFSYSPTPFFSFFLFILYFSIGISFHQNDLPAVGKQMSTCQSFALVCVNSVVSAAVDIYFNKAISYQTQLTLMGLYDVWWFVDSGWLTDVTGKLFNKI